MNTHVHTHHTSNAHSMVNDIAGKPEGDGWDLQGLVLFCLVANLVDPKYMYDH